ncbi:MAG: hypothetical protein A2X94_02170 [Bdellovibrionales bacterium GWB1_55_8]|nr:MAG: hypothetical protein A2X94_02170 [Bdellovibrionales bacterium GWB1_55_8]
MPSLKSLDSKKIEQVFAKYISTRKILIADEAASSRTGLARTLVDMGAKSNLVTLASSLAIAEQEMARVQPHVVLCDFDLGRGAGLNLLQSQRKNRPETKESLFILVTANTSQSAVAQAAEEDVDCYIIKPYTIEVMRRLIMEAAIAKLQPDEYSRLIEEGKNHLASKKTEEALKLFEKASGLSQKPSLACFYAGQANIQKNALDNAEGSYTKGLVHNKIHYKCMVGLFELMMQKKMHTEAYAIVKRISQYFPANPQRLASVLRLAIITRSYDDIEGYYQAFTGLDHRNDEIVRYICAALVVCGKYYLSTGSQSRALSLFQKAAVTGTGRTKILREAITTLLEFQLVQEASTYLGRFPPDTQSGVDYLASEYMIANQRSTPGMVIEKGRKLIKQGAHDPTIYKILIHRSRQAGLAEAAESLIRDALERFPENGNDFIKVPPPGA